MVLTNGVEEALTHSNFEATSKHDAEYLQFIHLNNTDPSNVCNLH